MQLSKESGQIIYDLYKFFGFHWHSYGCCLRRRPCEYRRRHHSNCCGAGRCCRYYSDCNSYFFLFRMNNWLVEASEFGQEKIWPIITSLIVATRHPGLCAVTKLLSKVMYQSCSIRSCRQRI